jgi:beta-lactamase class A
MQTPKQNQRFYSYQTGSRLQATPKSRRTGRKAALFGIAIIMSFFIIKGAMALGDSEPKNNTSPVAEKIEEPKEPPKKMIDTTALQTSLNQIVEKYPFDTSVAVVELNSGKVIQVGDSSPYVAASVTKVLSAVMYLDKVEQGSATLGQTIAGKPAREQLRLMINRSDNTAWYRINQYLRESNLEIFARQQGLTSYDAIKNTISAQDMATIMAKLHNREILNEENTQLLYSWMQNTSEERFIPASIPAGTKAYHKTGYLTDRIHDAAIIENEKAPFVLVIFSKSLGTSPYSYPKGQELYKEITTQALKAFAQ